MTATYPLFIRNEFFTAIILWHVISFVQPGIKLGFLSWGKLDGTPWGGGGGGGGVGQIIQGNCGDQSVVAAIKGGYCRDPAMAHMLRCLFFLGARFQLTLTAAHVPGVDNGAADALELFFDLIPQLQANSAANLRASAMSVCGTLG